VWWRKDGGSGRVEDAKRAPDSAGKALFFSQGLAEGTGTRLNAERFDCCTRNDWRLAAPALCLPNPKGSLWWSERMAVMIGNMLLR